MPDDRDMLYFTGYRGIDMSADAVGMDQAYGVASMISHTFLTVEGAPVNDLPADTP